MTIKQVSFYYIRAILESILLVYADCSFSSYPCYQTECLTCVCRLFSSYSYYQTECLTCACHRFSNIITKSMVHADYLAHILTIRLSALLVHADCLARILTIRLSALRLNADCSLSSYSYYQTEYLDCNYLWLVVSDCWLLLVL